MNKKKIEIKNEIKDRIICSIKRECQEPQLKSLKNQKRQNNQNEVYPIPFILD